MESFLGFIECTEGTTGEAVATLIMDGIKDLGLDMSKCRLAIVLVNHVLSIFYRGQSYDGSGNMAGSVRGAAARIKSAYPLVMYIHCASHQLNLCVMKSCSVQVCF